MDSLLSIVFGVLAGWWVAGGKLPGASRITAWWRRTPQAAAEPPVAETLAMRLQRLEAKLIDFPTSSAHPRDFAEEAAFKDACAILADPKVSLDTVVHYALGNSGLWPL